MMPIKWAYEYKNNKEKYYPVKFVEYCSLNKNSTPIYDDVNENGEKIMTKVEYIGRNC